VAVSLGYKNVYRDPYGYPEWKARGLPVETVAASNAAPDRDRAPGPLYGWAMLWTLLGVFAGGMALNLTPCVYPLIPITVSYFGGRGARKQGGLLAHGLFYIGGLALTNSLLGVFAALTGGLMGAMLQSPIVLIVVVAVLLIFASSLFGFWELRLPTGLTQAASRSYTGYFGSLFMGLTLGVVAAPCIGPFVLGLLTWVAGMGSPWLGFLIFFTLSLGLGLPLLALALFSGKLDRLPRSGAWMVWVRKLMGWVLVGMAVYFVEPLLPHGWRSWSLAVVALAAGLHLGWLERSKADIRGFPWMKSAAGIGGLVLGAYLIGGWLFMGAGVSWRPYSDELLMEARESKKPVIIDFYADWCAPCRELEDITFHDPSVVGLAAGFVMVKVDLTRKDDSLNRLLLEKYKIKGVPTVVFIDGGGRERRDLRLVDFIAPDKFLGLMTDIRNTKT